MKKVKILFTVIILLAGMFFIVQSCQKEDLLVGLDFENQFSLNEFQDEFVKTNLMVDWNDFKKSESQGENTQYIFNASLKTNSSIHSSNGSLDFKYQILANVNKDGKTSFEILKFLANDDKLIEKISYLDTEFFSGTLYQYDLKGELLKMTAFKNGIELEKIASDKMILMSQSKYAPKEDGWVILRTEFWTDWYTLIGGVWVYTHSTLNNVTSEWVYVGGAYDVDSSYHFHSDNTYTGHPNPGINTHANEILVFVNMPDNPFTNIQDVLDCFDISSSAYLTIYSKEPNPGSGDTHDLNYVGHSFVSIIQGNNVCTVGFYPTENNVNPFTNKSSNSILGNDGGEIFTVSVRNTISGTQLQNIINYISNVPATYNLDTYNCTDFAIQVGNLGGIPLPDCFGSWPGGSGSNPGTLGEFIRDNPTLGTINTTTSSAVNSNQGC